MTHGAITRATATGGLLSTLTGPHNESILLAPLQEASQKAARLNRGIITSVQLPMKRLDPIHIFTHLRRASSNCFFWQQPAKKIAYVGGGSAYSIEKHGATHFTEMTTSLQFILDDAVIVRMRENSGKGSCTPLFFGGFAFDASRPHTQLWEGFPDGLLVLPDLLICQDGEQANCIINTVVQPTDEVAHHQQKMTATIKYLDEVTTCASLSHKDYRACSCPPVRQGSQTIAGLRDVCPDPTHDLEIHDIVSRSDWTRLLAQTVEQIREGSFQKVILARGVEVRYKAEVDTPFDVDTVLSRLNQNETESCIFAIQRGERFFVGATPERLVHVQDRQLQTMALAGTAPRGASEEEDRYIGEQLLLSKKNQNEHTIVIEMLRKSIENLCSHVCIADNPLLLKLANLQHLITPITGKLIAGRSILDVIADLHPTPAVGGLPLQPALQAIREGEDLDRGWYAGPLGWMDAHGNGEFIVALRSALLHGKEATLFAGCGIVADSDPQSEYLESCLKLQVMLRGLGKTHNPM